MSIPNTFRTTSRSGPRQISSTPGRRRTEPGRRTILRGVFAIPDSSVGASKTSPTRRRRARLWYCLLLGLASQGGARLVGGDPTAAQLATAREMQQAFDLHFALVEAVAESVPLPDASFDLALEYGASIWPTHIAGFRKRLDSSAPADVWCSCGTRRWWCSAPRRSRLLRTG